MQGWEALNPHDLLKTARELLASNRGKPRQSNLHRATSTAYYALFHALAKCCADMLVGGTGSDRSGPAWAQVYRSLNHAFAKKACRTKALEKFPQEIQDFANMFVQMQSKRHEADYNPNARVHKTSVSIDIDAVEAVLTDFLNAPRRDRRAFAALVLFKDLN